MAQVFFLQVFFLRTAAAALLQICPLQPLGLWHSSQQLPAKTIAMLQQLLSVTQTAERLRVRPDYVHELVKKQRLTFIHGEQLDAAQVEKLAKLMDRLRNDGIAALVQIVVEKGDLESD